MPETGNVVFGDKSAAVTYTSNYQLYEIYETNAISRDLLSTLHIGNSIVLEEVDGRKVTLMITDTIIGQAARLKAIIKR